MHKEVNDNTPLGDVAVSVLGAGLMGRGIAGVFLEAGLRVSLYDPSGEALALAQETLSRHTRVGFFDDLERATVDSRFVLEAVPEILEVKSQALRQVSEMLPEAVIATNTSGFRIGELAGSVINPARFVGTHFFNPAGIVPLVEVVGGPLTDIGVLDWTLRLLRRAGKRPVRVGRDIPVLIANRLQHALWREALALVEAGVCTAETIDEVVLGSFGPRLAVVGPMENADYIGLDLLASVQRRLLPEISSAEEVSPLLEKHLASGQVGRRTGRGLMEWSSDRTEAFEQRLLSAAPMYALTESTDPVSDDSERNEQ